MPALISHFSHVHLSGPHQSGAQKKKNIAIATVSVSHLMSKIAIDDENATSMIELFARFFFCRCLAFTFHRNQSIGIDKPKREPVQSILIAQIESNVTFGFLLAMTIIFFFLAWVRCVRFVAVDMPFGVSRNVSSTGIDTLGKR